MQDTYRIYIHSTKNPRTINTPMMGRTYYERISVNGKEAFIQKLNKLIATGAVVQEVRYGWGGAWIPYWKYIATNK